MNGDLGRNVELDLEDRLVRFYAGEATSGAPDRLLDGLLAAVATTPQRHSLRARVGGGAFGIVALRRGSGRQRALVWLTVLVALAIAVGGVAVAAINRLSTPSPIMWSTDRYAEDWPAPLRQEPDGGAPDVLLVRGELTHWDEGRGWQSLEYVDPLDDVGPGGIPTIDIRMVTGGGIGSPSFTIYPAGGVPMPATDPADRWIGYGMVADLDGDGVADERFGVDNMPDGSHRAWATDLHTGQTKWKAGPGYGTVYDDGDSVGALGLDTWYPTDGEETETVILRYSGEPGRHYAWASMIEDGRVVATDYAPDVGWLVSPPDPGLPLVGTHWTLERELPSRDMTIVMWFLFTDDGLVEIELCTRGTASVDVTEDTIRVSDIDLSEDACSDETEALPEVIEMESELLDLLDAGEFDYAIDGGFLELRAGDHTVRLHGQPGLFG